MIGFELVNLFAKEHNPELLGDPLEDIDALREPHSLHGIPYHQNRSMKWRKNVTDGKKGRRRRGNKREKCRR